MLLLVCATCVGLALVSRLRLPLGPFARFGVGAALGQLGTLWLPFLLATAFDFDVASAALAASALLLLALLPVGLSLRRDRAPARAWLSSLRRGLGARENRATVAVAGALGVLLLWLHHTHYLRPMPDGLHSAGVTWGDLPIHLALTSRFLHAEGLPPLEHPLYLGGPLTYPFLPDYAVALLASQGMSLRAAFIAAGMLPLGACMLLLHGLCRLWLPSSPRWVTALALPLFLLAGGLGAWEVLGRMLEGDASPWQVLAGMNATYIEPHVLKSGHIGNLFLAARTAAPGMTLGLAALLLLGHVVESPRPPPRLAFVLIGALAGGLPLVHGHSFLVCSGLVGAYLLLARRHGARWAYCIVPAVACAAPQVAWLARAGAPSYLRWTGGFLRPAPRTLGWLIDLGMGMGAWLVLVPLAFALAPPRARRLSLPLLLLLPLANVVTFTPTLYDNVKLLAWFDVAAAILVAGMLAQGLSTRAGEGGAVPRLAPPLSVLAFVGCTLSGALAVGHELANDAVVFTRRDVALASLVAAHTAPDAVVVTAASYHDPVALLSGRRVALATPWMLRTHGIDPRERALSVMRIYAGGPAARKELERLGAAAIVIGHRERAAFEQIDEGFLKGMAVAEHEREGQRLLLLRRPE